MSEQQADQRIFERFSARFPAKFKHSPNEFGTSVFLRDASAQGIRLTTREHMFLHDSVSLMVKLPDGPDPMTLNGHVVWIKEREPNLWDIGVEFHKVHLMALQRMFKLVDRV